MAGYPYKYSMHNRFMKFSLYLVTDFEGKRDTTLFSRTFAPKVEWDPQLYELYKDYPFEDMTLDGPMKVKEQQIDGEGTEEGEETVNAEVVKEEAQ